MTQSQVVHDVSIIFLDTVRPTQHHCKEDIAVIHVSTESQQCSRMYIPLKLSETLAQPHTLLHFSLRVQGPHHTVAEVRSPPHHTPTTTPSTPYSNMIQTRLAHSTPRCTQGAEKQAGRPSTTEVDGDWLSKTPLLIKLRTRPPHRTPPHTLPHDVIDNTYITS